jgi:hypothetical protein
MDATVFAGGYAFSGRLVGAPTFFDTVAGLADDDAVALPFRKLADDYRAEDDDKVLVTTYLHMLDVDVFGGAKHLGRIPAWRGRLSQVSGWTTERLRPRK